MGSAHVIAERILPPVQDTRFASSFEFRTGVDAPIDVRAFFVEQEYLADTVGPGFHAYDVAFLLNH